MMIRPCSSRPLRSRSFAAALTRGLWRLVSIGNSKNRRTEEPNDEKLVRLVLWFFGSLVLGSLVLGSLVLWFFGSWFFRLTSPVPRAPAPSTASQRAQRRGRRR